MAEGPPFQEDTRPWKNRSVSVLLLPSVPARRDSQEQASSAAAARHPPPTGPSLQSQLEMPPFQIRFLLWL